MKNKILLFGMIACALLSCEKKVETTATTITEPVDNEKIKTEIQTLETAYAEAMNTGNADAVVAYYSDDAVSYSQDEPPLVGRAAIKEYTLKKISESPKDMKVAFTTNEVHPSSDGNQVVELGGYKAMDSTNTVKFSGNYMAVFVKKDGKYICTRDMGVADTKRAK